MTRLDKYLADANIATRKELRDICRSGRVTVNGAVVRDPGAKVDEKKDLIALDGKPVTQIGQIVIMLNKPDGYVCATEDKNEKTVMELLPKELGNAGVVPVGRLDKNTEGLLLLTNDGNLLHHIISPKHDIPKEYFVVHDGCLSREHLKTLEAGITLKDGTECKAAQIEILSTSECIITISEGKYHQVRRMMAACGCHVTYLKRISEAGLKLEGLSTGEWRELNETEIRTLSQ